MVLRAATTSAATRGRELTINGTTLRLAQHFFDTPVAQPRGLRRADLTGLKVWPTALRMLTALEDTVLPALRETAGRPLRVLELGSGTGVLGLGVAALGGVHVVLTDPDLPVQLTDEGPVSSSLDWLRSNVEANREKCGGRAEVQPLEWSSGEHASRLRERCLRPGEEFDLVLGSELLYDPDQYEPLEAVLRDFCRTDATLAVLGYTRRHGGEARFLQRAAKVFEHVRTDESARTGDAPAWAVSQLRRLRAR